MSGKHSRLKALASRKQLLLVESELNRAQLMQEWQTIAGEFHALARQAKSISAMASVAGLLIAGISSCRREKSTAAAEEPSWWRTILKYTGVASSIWAAFRTPPRK